MQTKISDIIDRRHVIPGLIVQDKAALVDELAKRAAVAQKLEARTIAAALNARERLGSTGVGKGVAIPHARIDGVGQFFGMFVRLDQPIAFDAIDGEPVDLVFLLLTPAQGAASYLSALACISRRLRDAKTAETLRGAATAKEMCETLIGPAIGC